MSVADKTTLEKSLPWIIWAAISPVVLYTLLNSSFGLLIVILGALGGGGFLLIGLAVLVFGGGAIGWCSDREGGFAKGVAFVLIPFVGLFVYFCVSDVYSDENVASIAQRKAEALLEKQDAIPITGLYVESISLRYSLNGLLVDRRIPMIEGDVSGAGWLFDLTNDIMSIKSAGRKYFRLSLGSIDNPDCFAWRNESDNPVKSLSVRSQTCVRISFDNTLLSDAKLHLNSDRIERRELYWELFRIGENVPIVSVPFWDRYYKDSPSQYYPRYQSPNAGAFTGLIRKLTPRGIKPGADEYPFVLN